MRFVGGIRDYFNHSSIQGLKYISEPERHWTERLFWIISCLLATFGMLVLAEKSYSNYVNNPVSFLISRDRLEWNTSFPSISVCEADADLGGINSLASRVFGEDHDLDYETFLRDIVFYEGKCYSCDELCGKTINCTNHFADILEQGRQPCSELIFDCTWMGEPFACCQYFKPLITETGNCFTINSLHTNRSEDKWKFMVNKLTGPGFLAFKVKRDVNIYIHNTEEVPFINIPQEEKKSIFLGTNYQMGFSVTEIENDPMLTTIPVDKRKCRFPEENNLEAYRYYSYSSCVVDCRARAQLEYCNCTHHFMPTIANATVCDLVGLSCLSMHSKIIGSLRTSDSSKPGLVCDCFPSCTEHDFQITENVFSGSGSSLYSSIRISMKSLPETRFRRYIVRTTLDLVVSLGGTAGLFLGVSILSVAEWAYYGLLRYQIWKCKQRKKQRVNMRSSLGKKVIPSLNKHNAKDIYRMKIFPYLK